MSLEAEISLQDFCT